MVFFIKPHALKIELFSAKSNLSFCVCGTKHFTKMLSFYLDKDQKTSWNKPETHWNRITSLQQKHILYLSSRGSSLTQTLNKTKTVPVVLNSATALKETYPQRAYYHNFPSP